MWYIFADINLKIIMEDAVMVELVSMEILGVEMVGSVRKEYEIGGKKQVRRYKKPVIKYNCKLKSPIEISPNYMAIDMFGNAFQAIDNFHLVNCSILMQNSHGVNQFSVPSKMLLVPCTIFNETSKMNDVKVD